MDKLYNALICLAEMFRYDLSSPKPGGMESINSIPDYDIPKNPYIHPGIMLAGKSMGTEPIHKKTFIRKLIK